MNPIIDLETATKDVDNWLAIRKVRASVRAKQKDAIDVLIEAVQDGILVVAEDGSLEHTLLHPINTEEGQQYASKFTYKPRFKVAELSKQMDNINTSNFIEITAAYVSAVIGQPKSIVKAMDSTDFKIAQSVAGFFI